jgi:S-adenosyl methyltransferase
MTGWNPLDRAGPTVAGVYNHLLGGRDNFIAGRELAAALTAICPVAADLAKENRAFLARAVTWAAEAGIGQFLDLAAGFPVSPLTHETVRAVRPDARVAYVDTDPVVVAHAKALLTGPGITVHERDLRDADAILGEVDKDGWELAEPACGSARSCISCLRGRPAIRSHGTCPGRRLGRR